MTNGLAIKESLRKFRGDIDRLQYIIEPLLEGVRRDAINEDMGLMSFCFLNKQKEHTRSICILVDNQQYRDAWLISRTMFEGTALLLWATEDISRAYDWKSYHIVEKFKRLYGQPEYLTRKEEVECNLQTYCRKFLKEKSKTKPQSQIIPNDYYDSWHLDKREAPISITKIIRSAEITPGVKLEPLFRVNYSLPSGWIHWSPLFIGDALKFEHDCLDYCRNSMYLGQLAYMNGFNSLLLTAMVFDEVFNLESSDLYAEFKKNLLKFA
jgi:hypothetical protein